MPTIDVDASLAADSLEGSDLTGVFQIGAGPEAGSSIFPALSEIHAATAHLTSDSMVGPSAWVGYSAQAGLSAGSGLSGFEIDRKWITAGISAGASMEADEKSLIRLVLHIQAQSGFSCPGFEKIHRNTPVPRVPQMPAPPSLRLVPPPATRPHLSINVRKGR